MMLSHKVVVTITLITIYSLVIIHSSVHAVPTVIYPYNNDLSSSSSSLLHPSSSGEKIVKSDKEKNIIETSESDTLKTTISPLTLDDEESTSSRVVRINNDKENNILTIKSTGNDHSNAMNNTSENLPMKNQFNDEVNLNSDTENNIPLTTQSVDGLVENISSVTTTIDTLTNESENTNVLLPAKNNNKTNSNNKNSSENEVSSLTPSSSASESSSLSSSVKSSVMNQTESTLLTSASAADGKISIIETTSQSPFPPVAVVEKEKNETNHNNIGQVSSTTTVVSTVASSTGTFVPSSTNEHEQVDLTTSKPVAATSGLKEDEIKNSSDHLLLSSLATTTTTGDNNDKKNVSSTSPSPVTLDSASTAGAVESTITTTTAASTTSTGTTTTTIKETAVTFAVSHVNQTTREGRTDDSDEGESINYDGNTQPTTLPAFETSPSSDLTEGQRSSNRSSSTIPVTLQPLLNENVGKTGDSVSSSSITDQSKSPPSELMTTPVAFNFNSESPSPTPLNTVTTTITSTITPLGPGRTTGYTEVNNTNNNNNTSSSTDVKESEITIHDNVTSSSNSGEGNTTPLDSTFPAGGTRHSTVTLPSPAVTLSTNTVVDDNAKHAVEEEEKNSVKETSDSVIENNDLGGSSEISPKINTSYSSPPVVTSELDNVVTTTSTASTIITSATTNLTNDSDEKLFNVSVTPQVYPELPSNDVTSGSGDLNVPINGNETQEDVKLLHASEAPSTISKDRSSRREAHSLLSICMNSVEIFVVSVVVIFFTASALVICLLVGFCKRKGNTFDVQVRLFLFCPLYLFYSLLSLYLMMMSLAVVVVVSTTIVTFYSYFSCYFVVSVVITYTQFNF